MRAPTREHTLGRVEHPDPFRVSDSGRVLTLIDDPVADRLAKGDATLGWEGDERLALYLDPVDRTWDLWRLEHDGVYRCCRRLACDAFSSIEVVPELILWLVTFDQRRGFDVMRFADAENAKAAAEADIKADEFADEAADRFIFGLLKDGV